MCLQATQDRGLSHSDFGKGSRPKGNRPNRCERSDAQDEGQEFAPRNKSFKGNGKRANYLDSIQQEAYSHRKGDRRPQQFDTRYQWQPPPDRNTQHWGAQTSPTPADTRQGWGQRRQWPNSGGKNNSLLDDSTLSSNLIQCEDRAALLGTNSSSSYCTSSSHLEVLQQFKRFAGLEAFDNPSSSGFLAPSMYRSPTVAFLLATLKTISLVIVAPLGMDGLLHSLMAAY